MAAMTKDTNALEDDVFSVLMLCASQEGVQQLPTFEEAVAVEIAAGTIAYVAGAAEAGKVPSYEVIRAREGKLKMELNDITRHTIGMHGDRLHPDLAATLVTVTHFEFCTDHGERWWETPLRWRLHYLPGVNPMRSTFALTVPFVATVRKTIRRLPPDMREQCEAIGSAMRPFISRDLVFIQKTVRW